jgi:hypothetical protein
VLFGFRIDQGVSYLAARDTNGDGHPEIIVAAGTGASVGGWLQVLSFDGAALRELARIGGHFFSVRSKGVGKPSVIDARWKEQRAWSPYEWNGARFEKANIKKE